MWGFRVAIVGYIVFSLGQVSAQDDHYNVRLSPVPINANLREQVTGQGSATAVLDGRRLTIHGSFQGLQAPATIARLHLGSVTGVRGPSIFDLDISHNSAGTVSAILELTATQVDALRAGRFYIQIHSEIAPDGNLWGWLLQ